MIRKNQRPIAVLGMHRSGTSSLAGELERAGIELGDVIQRAQYNLKGNLENTRVLYLNDAVLAHSGGSWHDPPDRLLWADEHRAQRDQIINSYQTAYARWGFKDPRTLLTLEFWLEAEVEWSFFGTVRHPAAVADSLGRRDTRTGGSRGLALWETYNRRLLAAHRTHGFPVVCFDLPEADYLGSVDKALRQIHVTPPPRTAEGAFFVEDLRRTNARGASCTPSATQTALFDEILAVCETPPDRVMRPEGWQPMETAALSSAQPNRHGLLDLLRRHGLLPHNKLLEVGIRELADYTRYLEPGNAFAVEADAAHVARVTDQLRRTGALNREPTVTIAPFDHPETIGETYDFIVSLAALVELPMQRVARFMHGARLGLSSENGLLFASWFDSPSTMCFDSIEHPADLGPPTITHGERAPFHHSFETLSWLATNVGLTMEAVDDWSHPEGLRMARFTPR